MVYLTLYIYLLRNFQAVLWLVWELNVLGDWNRMYISRYSLIKKNKEKSAYLRWLTLKCLNYFQDQNWKYFIQNFTFIWNTISKTSRFGNFWKYDKLDICILKYQRGDKCFTDGNGPDVFVKCAYEWPKPNTELNKKWNTYETLGQGTQCDKSPPPSYYNQLCRAYYDKIKDLE